jgi:hypothetical protein
MSHPRAAIRQALVDKLQTKVDDAFPTDAGDKVYGSRAKPLFDQFLPAILVYTRNENIIEERFATDGYGASKRELEVAIEAVVLGNEQVDDALDKISKQIEDALDGFEMPIRKADILKLKSTEIDVSIDGSKIYGAARLTYSITYYTSNKQPDNSGTIPTEIEANFP